jgi:hypothetical protein
VRGLELSRQQNIGTVVDQEAIRARTVCQAFSSLECAKLCCPLFLFLLPRVPWGSCAVRDLLRVAEVPPTSRAPSTMRSSARSVFGVREKTRALCAPEPGFLTFTWCAQTAAVPPPSRSHSVFSPKVLNLHRITAWHVFSLSSSAGH